jgi:CRP-like cAMP-binding protein
MRRLTQDVTAAAASTDTSGIWLRPYMKATKRKKGHVLFKKGDEARHLYLLASGRSSSSRSGERRARPWCSARSPSSRRTAGR